MTGFFLPDAKARLIELTSLSKDVLHVHVGLIVFFAAMLLLRRKLGDWWPWTIVLAVTLLGEVWDVRDRWAAGLAADPGGHLQDILNTLFWPTALTLAFRISGRFRRRR